MTAFVLNEIRKGFYLDSVALMRLSREIAALPGVREAALMMATPANKAILRDAGLLESGDVEAHGNDLVVAMRADDEPTARAALGQALLALDGRKTQSGAHDAWTPRSIAAAVSAAADANLALISVPGEFAAAEARKALRHGLHVMMFSDNVSIEDELSLKQEARERGLLLMGPDCGTAIIGDAPLAFANKIKRGPVGIIGASGTGTQEVSCLLSEAGSGVSHAIGVGGRDLKKEVGGITTLMAIDALDADEATERVVLISKPPHPDVARTVLARIAKSSKPYTVCFIGLEQVEVPANATFAPTLKDAAKAVLGGLRIGSGFDASAIAARHGVPAGRGARIEGLFAGGTLCAEAQVFLKNAGRRVSSNAPVPGVAVLENAQPGQGDRILDLGADEYTRGRPHPMIDPSIRDDALRTALENTDIAVILLDLIIGYGAHSDPAGHLAEVIAGRRPDAPLIIGSVTGTEADPQIRSRQVRTLEEAGVLVAPSNAQACEVALKVLATVKGEVDAHA
ncbi:acyl-CoA synthetase FdrA [Mesorhizobium xinjiangense]|uniref:acyl-CoA synthetase FdrA n=1 Tax=Mesorhizobium xinjiangense TaxID=2678685 RepID=UPI0012ECE872|nr:acyl-CoA synthetase FdrA [Mesorhizobium xinjiangense]